MPTVWAALRNCCAKLPFFAIKEDVCMKTDIEIAQEAKMKPITQIAAQLGLEEESVIPYGRYKAKIDHRLIHNAKKQGKLILVTAISPTPAGEGKTTTSVGLADAMNALGKKTMLCLREPSLGPVFGVKGGAAGGGYAQVVPMEDINLHFTGDLHAIGTANNLLAAMQERSPLTSEDIQTLSDDFTQGRSGSRLVTLDGTRYYMTYQSAHILDWTIVGLVPAAVVNAGMNALQSSTIVMVSMIVLGISALALALVHRKSSVKLRRKDTEILYRDELLVVVPCGHPLADAAAFPLSALSAEPFIRLEEGRDYELTAALDAMGVHPNVKYTAREDRTILAMVSSGLGISIMEELMLYRCAYPLVSCSLPQSFYRNIGICVKDRNALSNSTRAFIDHTRRWVLANFPDGWNAPPPTVR